MSKLGMSKRPRYLPADHRKYTGAKGGDLRRGSVREGGLAADAMRLLQRGRGEEKRGGNDLAAERVFLLAKGRGVW